MSYKLIDKMDFDVDFNFSLGKYISKIIGKLLVIANIPINLQNISGQSLHKNHLSYKFEKILNPTLPPSTPSSHLSPSLFSD